MKPQKCINILSAVTEEEHELIKKEALDSGMTLSAFIRLTVLTAVNVKIELRKELTKKLNNKRKK